MIPVLSFTKKHWNFYFANITVTNNFSNIYEILATFYAIRRDILLDRNLITRMKSFALCYYKKLTSAFLYYIYRVYM